MNLHNNIEKELHHYLMQFENLYNQVLTDRRYVKDLEILVDQYSQWILDPLAKQQYLAWDHHDKKRKLTQQLQAGTSQCVKQVEVIRAERLLNGQTSTSGYFNNIEHCINEELVNGRLKTMTSYC